MAVKYDSRLGGIMNNTFRIGSQAAGTLLKNSSGTLLFRNPADSAHASVTVNSIKIHGSNASFGITLAAPGSLGANVTLTLPSDDGASGEVLHTDGAGSLYWAAPTAGAITLETQAFTQASSSPITFFTPSVNARLLRFKVIVTSPASGGSPTLSVGVAGTVDLYVLTTDNDLKTAGEYLIDNIYDAGGSPAAVIITIVVSGQTFTGEVICEWAS